MSLLQVIPYKTVIPNETKGGGNEVDFFSFVADISFFFRSRTEGPTLKHVYDYLFSL